MIKKVKYTDIKNIRYSENGNVAFDYNNKTYYIKEPFDILLVGHNDKLAAKWILQHYGSLFV